MKLFLAFIALLFLNGEAFAGDNVQINTGSGQTQTYQLPGNATVVTGGDSNGGTYIYNGDQSVANRLLFGPNVRTYYSPRNFGGNAVANIPGTADLSTVNSVCAGARNASERNSCTRDVIRDQDRLRRRL